MSTSNQVGPDLCVVVSGPQGCGKSRNAMAVARFFGLSTVVEYDALPQVTGEHVGANFTRRPGHLFLTSIPVESITAHGCVVMRYADVDRLLTAQHPEEARGRALRAEIAALRDGDSASGKYVRERMSSPLFVFVQQAQRPGAEIKKHVLGDKVASGCVCRALQVLGEALEVNVAR